MSDFLQNPDFQPDEGFKNFIDSLFEQKPRKKIAPPRETESSFELDLPEAPALAEPEMKLALKISSDELEMFKTAFLDFQDKVSDMAIYTFLYPSLEEFGEACAEMVDLIGDNFNQEELTEVGRADYKEIIKLRGRILAAVYNKYKNEK